MSLCSLCDFLSCLKSLVAVEPAVIVMWWMTAGEEHCISISEDD